MIKYSSLFFFFWVLSCTPISEENKVQGALLEQEGIELLVLGIAQDAGYPQADCKKSCCSASWNDKSMRKMVSCIGLRDWKTKKAWMFDATPDFKDQHRMLTDNGVFSLEGIFLSHAHMGHYTGLMHLGREAMGAKAVPVYVMPRMKEYLTTNGPWSQLVSLNNIQLIDLTEKNPVGNNFIVETFMVPHRDEFSETVGFNLIINDQSILFIPDIDKWSKWDKDIKMMVRNSQVAFLDGTFFRNGEIRGRDMSEIPHPFVEESTELFAEETLNTKSKIHFIHLNHTNPLLRSSSEEWLNFSKQGFKVAEEGASIVFEK